MGDCGSRTHRSGYNGSLCKHLVGRSSAACRLREAQYK